MRKYQWTPEEIERYRREEEARPRIYLELPQAPPPKKQPPKEESHRGVIVIQIT